MIIHIVIEKTPIMYEDGYSYDLLSAWAGKERAEDEVKRLRKENEEVTFQQPMFLRAEVELKDLLPV